MYLKYDPMSILKVAMFERNVSQFSIQDLLFFWKMANVGCDHNQVYDFQAVEADNGVFQDLSDCHNLPEESQNISGDLKLFMSKRIT